MLRMISLPVISLVLCMSACCASDAKLPEITDPAEAQKDPDFKIQGEYLGEGKENDGSKIKVGAQVIALGNGLFDIVSTDGGLPGDGWKRGDDIVKLQGKRQGDSIVLSSQGVSIGKIADGTMTLDLAGMNGADIKLELKRTVRHSPTEGAKPPVDAVVLFDGTTAENFVHGTLLKNKNLLSEATTKKGLGDYTLHLEFRTSYMPEARGQARGNSGVYLHDCYEIQVLDTFGLEGKDDECGGFYKLRQPDVNMCLPPLDWQTYDIEFTAPKYEDGKKVANAKVEVRHNGVLIHPEFELEHATPGRQEEGPAPRPFYLQGHGNKIEYRNIWVKEKK